MARKIISSDKLIEFFLGFNINCNIQVNGKRVPALVTYLLFLAGVRQIWKHVIKQFYRGFILQFWHLLKGSWAGQSGSGYLGSII